MNSTALKEALFGLPIGPLRYFNQISSTNTEAAHWVDAGAPDMALVIADGQTAGRGRSGRKWHSHPGTSLTFSLVLRDTEHDTLQEKPQEFPVLPRQAIVARITALGALAVSQALHLEYNLPAQIKWPNDVLLTSPELPEEWHKVAGVLTEAYWHGNQLAALVLGIGINITPAAIPPAGDLVFPATSVETALGQQVSRLDILRSVLVHMITWRARLSKPEFMQTWEEQLAFRGEWVQIYSGADSGDRPIRQGKILGLDSYGRLRLGGLEGAEFSLHYGEIRLRPLSHPAVSEQQFA